MKKAFLLFLPIFLFSISCTEDDDLTFVQENYILGKWFLAQIGAININNTIVYEDFIADTACEGDNLVLY